MFVQFTSIRGNAGEEEQSHLLSLVCFHVPSTYTQYRQTNAFARCLFAVCVCGVSSPWTRDLNRALTQFLLLINGSAMVCGHAQGQGMKVCLNPYYIPSASFRKVLLKSWATAPLMLLSRSWAASPFIYMMPYLWIFCTMWDFFYNFFFL